eukprot:SAG11_NODE_1307_length_5243_cov_2.389774_5_plen_79_part_00
MRCAATRVNDRTALVETGVDGCSVGGVHRVPEFAVGAAREGEVERTKVGRIVLSVVFGPATGFTARVCEGTGRDPTAG